MKLTERDKIAHLYRRFSFGGSVQEIEEGLSLGVEGTIKKLIDYDSIPSNLNIHPYEFAWKEKEEAEVGIWRFRLWWVLSMASGKRPLQEKLSLFWHSHFAVSDAKVEQACLMLEYLQAIRKNANGKFGELLKSMAKAPAMMKYLDMQRAFKGHPNENFAREVMELFTMGIGNYSEDDIKEVSRALTGWGFMDTFYEGGNDNTQRLMTLYRDKRPAGAFCLFPSMRDTDPKTILGQTKDFDGDSVIDMLANRPETAKYISTKLWTFFAGENPSDATIAQIASVFTKTGGDIKQVLFAIARHPQFWSEETVLKNYKSPADYIIGNVRQMNLGQPLLDMRPKDATPLTPINQGIVDQVGHMTYQMYEQGLNLCYPDDVNGWKWGKAWITPNNMGKRMRYHGMMIWNDKGPWVAARNTQVLMAAGNPKDGPEMATRFKEIFDLHLNGDADRILTKFLTDQGPNCYKDPGHWAGVLYNSLKMLSACPDMHIC